MKLSKKEEQIYNRLVLITKSIYEIKQELQKLEMNNQKGSKAWQEKINELKTIMALENSIYNILTFKEIEHLSNYLFAEEHFDNIDRELNNILSLNKDKIIKTRIFNKLDVYFEDYKAKNPMNLADMLFPDDYKMGNVIKKDWVNTILTILNTYLNNPEYKAIQNYLVSIKYAISMIFIDNEEDLINNNFDINSLYWISDACSKKINFHLVYNSFFDKFDKGMLKTIKENYLDATSYQEGIFLQIIMRTYLLFTRNTVTKDTIVEIMQQCLDMIKPTELIFHINKVDYLVFSAIKYMASDKELTNVVTLN